jgi:hypothetical protein
MFVFKLQQVYRDADEAARAFCEGLTQEEREIFGLQGTQTNLEFQDLDIANLKWLQI